MPTTTSPAPSRAAGRDASAARLAQLRRLPRQPGEASFFWYDAHFRRVAVKVLPGEHFVTDEDLLVATTLGSCIAVCLWDRAARVGGINHFMLPGGADASGRFGAFAMEQLFNELLKRGARRSTMEAKVFGGGQVIAGMESLRVGERNTGFALDYLRAERIPVVARDVLGTWGRKVCFLPASGKVMARRLADTSASTLQRERELAAAPAAGGSVDLF